MCKNGGHCTRPLCFFAHRADELRFPQSDAPSSSGGALGTATSTCATNGSGPGDAAAAAALGAALAGGALSPASSTPAPPGARSASHSGAFSGAALADAALLQPGGGGAAAAAALAPMAAPPPLMAAYTVTDALCDFMPQDLVAGPAAGAFGAPASVGGFPLGAPPASAGLCHAPPAYVSAPAALGPAASAPAQPSALMRSYLEEQHRAVAAQRSALEQQRAALDLWLAQLQQQEAALGTASAAAASAPYMCLIGDEPGSPPLSIAPRLPSNTSSVSQFNSGPYRMELEPRAPAPLTSLPLSEPFTGRTPVGGVALPLAGGAPMLPAVSEVWPAPAAPEAPAAAAAPLNSVLNSLRRLF
jgi:hypothetical protein